MFANGFVFTATVALTAISSFSSTFCLASIVSAEDKRQQSPAYFTCDANREQRLCCSGEVRPDGTVADCHISQDVILSRSVQAPFGVATTNACNARLQGDGYLMAVCCSSKDLDTAGIDTYHGTGCVKGSAVASPQRKGGEDQPSRRAQQHRSALELLGLPTPRKVRVRNAVAGSTKNGNKATRSDDDLKVDEAHTAESKVRDEALPKAQKNARSAGFSFKDATRMFGLPAARKTRAEKPRAAANAKRAIETEPEAGNPAKPLVTTEQPSAAERVGLPVIKANEARAEDEGAQFTRRSRKVNAAMKKVRAQKVNVKAPRWIPSNGFMFVG